jgi:ABC-2 type transport system ATP-binding protein
MNAPQAAGVAISAAVSAAGLVKRYGELAAVDGLDLEIAPGEFFGLLGPNGSGKTTTMHMLATLVRPSAGTASVAGFDVLKAPVRVRASIGLVFQESALDRTLTVAQNLRFAGLLHDLPPRVIEERSRELLELSISRSGTTSRWRRWADAPGARYRARRAALPRCLLPDEPTIGLDLPTGGASGFHRAPRERGMTVLLTTHYLEEADGCDRVVFIRKGRLVESGAPRDLVARLGRHILEVEGADLDALVAALEPKLGPALREGDVAHFRCLEEDLTPLARLHADVGGKASAWRVRRPNPNDVFLWVAAGKRVA